MKALITRVHLWLGLLIGLQVLLWMLSGVVMSWLSFDAVTSADRRAEPVEVALDGAAVGFSSDDLLARERGVLGFTLQMERGEPVYRVRYDDGAEFRISARDGQPLFLKEEDARAIAAADYGKALPEAVVSRVSEAHYEIRGAQLPLYRVDVGDGRGSRIYISPYTGAVVARRNDYWRVYDFFWMLHIMDYGERDDFQNPLIRSIALCGLLFALSGLALVVMRWRSGRYGVDARLAKRGFSRWASTSSRDKR